MHVRVGALALGFVVSGWMMASCAEDGPGPALAPSLADGKADVADRVAIGGALGFGDAGAVSSSFVEDLEFHGVTLAVRPGATVTLEVTQAGSSKSLDTTLFVYGPRTAAGAYGTTAVAFDDDAGWGRLSKLSALPLAAGGTWLVVVGTHDGRGRGKYRLRATCGSDACEPLPVAEGCHPAIAEAIRACVTDHQNDPDYDATRVSPLDLIELCADPEIAAPAWDEVCAASDGPAVLCGLTMEQLTLTHLPLCVRQLTNEALDAACVFGERYRDTWYRPGAVVVLSERVLTASDTLDDLEKAQIVAAVRTTAWNDVATVEQAFEHVDGGEVNLADLWDASNRRAFRVLEVGSGDNSFGLFFEAGTTTPVAHNNDGDLLECTVTWGPERRPCTDDGDCEPGLRCTGRPAEVPRGRCIDTAADAGLAAGSSCSTSVPCASGLVCAGEPTSGEGVCVPAWMRGAFMAEASVPIPDAQPAGAEATLLVHGLATVDVDVVLDLGLWHPRPADLRVTLVNPAGTEVVISDHAGAGSELYLDGFVVRGFPGDESVNGVWRLRAVDTVSGEAGELVRFGLTLTSRWD